MKEEKKHRHHIIPKHMGGDDSETNLTSPISIKEHALLHKELWLKHGYKQDYIAWKALSGRITNEQARLMAAKIGQQNSVLYKKSRVITGDKLKKSQSFESRSKGGKAASKKLVQWQRDNADEFKAKCAELGAKNSQKNKIPHSYMGVTYQSKKDLQRATGMSICGFYGKLKRGEIVRFLNV